jgi:hypothetical protein
MNYEQPYRKVDACRWRRWVVSLFPWIIVIFVLTYNCQAFSTISILVIIAAVIGIGVGVPLSRKRHNNDMAAENSSRNASSEGNINKTPPPPNNSTDPSVFPKDPNLHQSFYGIAYSPEGSQLPNCGDNLGQIICIVEQLCFQMTWILQRLSSRTFRYLVVIDTKVSCGTYDRCTVVVTANQGVYWHGCSKPATGVNRSQRVRLYGADCNQSALVVSGDSDMTFPI